MARRFNCCVFNHPCPIYCRAVRSCENIVVNPIINTGFGFFNNTDVGAIASNARIPLSFVQGEGTTITSSQAVLGAISLSAGTYQITYFANGEVPASGTMSIKLRFNGVDVSGSILEATLPTGEQTTLTQTIVLTVSQTSTLELVNNSADNTIFSLASMFVQVL